MAADPYSTLGVARGAGDKGIKSAYRKLHPDRNKDNPMGFGGGGGFGGGQRGFRTEGFEGIDLGDIFGSMFGGGGGGGPGGGTGGKGEAGPGGAGDALVTIQIQAHPFFKRDGDNIRIDLPVSLDEAVGGAKVKVPTVEGAVMLTVSPGSSSGKTLRIKGRGMTRKDGSRGDQLVTLEIALPEGEDAADLARRLEGWHDPRPLRGRLGV